MPACRACCFLRDVQSVDAPGRQERLTGSPAHHKQAQPLSYNTVAAASAHKAANLPNAYRKKVLFVDVAETLDSAPPVNSIVEHHRLWVSWMLPDTRLQLSNDTTFTNLVQRSHRPSGLLSKQATK
jgi:hypothetical protein